MAHCQNCTASLAGRRRSARFCSDDCRQQHHIEKRSEFRAEVRITKATPATVTAPTAWRGLVETALSEWTAALEAHPEHTDVLFDLLEAEDTADVHFDYASLPSKVKKIARRLIEMSLSTKAEFAQKALEAHQATAGFANVAEKREQNRQVDRILGLWDSLPDDVKADATGDLLALCSGVKPRNQHPAPVQRIFDLVRDLDPTARSWFGPMAFVRPEPKADQTVEYRRSASLSKVVNAWHSAIESAPEHMAALSRCATDPHAMYSVDVSSLPKPVQALAKRLFNLNERARMEFSQAVGLG